MICGTPNYMSPELTENKKYLGQPADIWALGVLFYFLNFM
jgi:serine/threonine protein kinase